MTSENFVSIIIPCYNEERYIKNTIQCVLEQDYPSEKLEIIVVDGLSNDATPGILKDISAQHGNVKVIQNEKMTVPFAFNKAIPLSKGDFIVILGAHSEIPKNYVSLLVEKLIELDASNVGGLLETVAPDSSVKSTAIALACSSKIGMGNSHFRIGSDKIREVDTVPFGCYRKKVFDDIGYFDTELTRNQDDEFNARLIKNGGKIFLIPELKLTYFSRDNYNKLWRMFYQYGLFKPLVSKKIGKPTTMRQLVPPTFVLSILAMIILGFYTPLFWILLSLELILYLVILIASSLKIQTKPMSFGVTFHFVLSVFVIHLGYGFGYLKGLLLFMFFSGKPRLANFKSSR